MAKTKTNPALYTALGFPVFIENPRYIEFEGEMVLDIDHNKLQAIIFESLITKSARLSGAEVRFMRSYMKMTQTAFGETLMVDASSVSKWEKAGVDFTGMDSQVEMILRMRGKLHLSGRAHIASTFLDSLVPILRSKDIGPTFRIAV